jgi:hypothetical protein
LFALLALPKAIEILSVATATNARLGHCVVCGARLTDDELAAQTGACERCLNETVT